MKYLSVLFVSLLFFSTTAKADWNTDLEKAKKEAAATGKMILLNFSGSDWCVPCIKMKKEIFEQANFIEFANTQLILVKADFPRAKKNKLPKEQQKANNALADKYNKKGSFPLTVLLDAKGNIVKTWEGYTVSNVTEFINQIKAAK